jgi:hypothetical protein
MFTLEDRKKIIEDAFKNETKVSLTLLKTKKYD